MAEKLPGGRIDRTITDFVDSWSGFDDRLSVRRFGGLRYPSEADLRKAWQKLPSSRPWKKPPSPDRIDKLIWNLTIARGNRSRLRERSEADTLFDCPYDLAKRFAVFAAINAYFALIDDNVRRANYEEVRILARRLRKINKLLSEWSNGEDPLFKKRGYRGIHHANISMPPPELPAGIPEDMQILHLNELNQNLKKLEQSRNSLSEIESYLTSVANSWTQKRSDKKVYLNVFSQIMVECWYFLTGLDADAPPPDFIELIDAAFEYVGGDSVDGIRWDWQARTAFNAVKKRETVLPTEGRSRLHDGWIFY